MLRGVVIAPDQELRRLIEARIAETGHVLLLRSFDRYLTPDELRGFQRAHAPQVIFLDVASDPRIIETAAQLARPDSAALPVALHRQCEPELLLRLMQSGVREFLYAPFEKELFLQAVARIRQAVREAPAQAGATDLVFAFLPAKAGCGASIVAMNAAVHMARALEGEVLLADLDLNCGIARFLLKLKSAFGAWDALEKASALDDGLWSELVTEAAGIDVLAAGQIRAGVEPATGAVRRVLEFAVCRYRAIAIDLSGNFERYAIEALEECRRILLVVAPDLATVYLAREKLRFLRSLELEDRTSIVLNRWRRDACLSIADIESVIGLPVQYTLQDDPDAVYRSLLSGAPVDPATELGKELSRLGVFLTEARPEKAEITPKRRMVEYFSLLPARYTLFPGSK